VIESPLPLVANMKYVGLTGGTDCKLHV